MERFSASEAACTLRFRTYVGFYLCHQTAVAMEIHPGNLHTTSTEEDVEKQSSYLQTVRPSELNLIGRTNLNIGYQFDYWPLNNLEAFQR